MDEDGIVQEVSEAGDEREVVVHFTWPIADASGMIEGKFFDALRAGPWEDMYGRSVEFERDALPDMVENTMRAIASARTESGEVVGLPIDRINHEHGAAAGWITEVRLLPGGDLIQAKARWNKEGAELIRGNTMRHFSASVYTKANVIVGGSLVNWPAQVYADGTRALRPIELGASQDEAPLEIIMSNGNAVSSTAAPTAAEFAGFDRDAFAAQLREEIKGEVVASLRELMGEAKQGSDDKPANKTNLLEALELSGSTDVIVHELKQQLLDEHIQLQRRAQEEIERMRLAVRREARIAEFAGKMTTSGDGRANILNVGDLDAFKQWLMSLNPQQYEFAQKLLTSIVDGAGIVDVHEFGSDEEQKGGDRPLPAPMAEALDRGTLKIAQLGNPALNLGDLSQYDLTRWQGRGGAK